MRELWPKWSADDAKKGEYRTPSSAEAYSHNQFMQELRKKKSIILRLNGAAGDQSCFAFGQKTKYSALHRITTRAALTAATLWARGPDVSISVADFKLMSSIIFTTADACFPCW